VAFQAKNKRLRRQYATVKANEDMPKKDHVMQSFKSKSRLCRPDKVKKARVSHVGRTL